MAIKGLGGFHLVCDARNPQAVEKLRIRKQRKAKPLAVMACNTASLAEICVCSDHSAELLSSQPGPIVLLPKTVRADDLMPGVAPDLNCIGAMLPYTPIHYMLFLTFSLRTHIGYQCGLIRFQSVQILPY